MASRSLADLDPALRPLAEGWVRVECVHDPNPGNAPYDMERTEIRALTFFLPRAAS